MLNKTHPRYQEAILVLWSGQARCVAEISAILVPGEMHFVVELRVIRIAHDTH